MKKATADSKYPECRNCPALFPRRPHEKAYQRDYAALSFAKDGEEAETMDTT